MMILSASLGCDGSGGIEYGGEEQKRVDGSGSCLYNNLSFFENTVAYNEQQDIDSHSWHVINALLLEHSCTPSGSS